MELVNISDYCKKNNINLVFFIPPTHIDLQEQVKYFSLQKEENKFKNDLHNIAKTYDFDYSNKLTVNKNNFSDPFHLNKELFSLILNDLFINENPKYSK